MSDLVITKDHILMAETFDRSHKKKIIFVAGFNKKAVRLTENPKEAKKYSNGVAQILAACLIPKKHQYKLKARKVK